jgi:oxygen-independent coproporphyrinogen-3 oxidase
MLISSQSGCDAVRFSTPDVLEKYVAGSAFEKTLVPPADALEETFFLGLRLNRGVNLRQIAAAFGEEALRGAHAVIKELVSDGLLQRENECIRLTARGRLFSNEVFQRFIAIGDCPRA